MSDPMRHFRSCHEIFAELSAYLDGELPEEACREIEEHLHGCSPCEAFLVSLRKTVELCRRYAPGALPGPLREEARHALWRAYEQMLARRRNSGL
ncbi:MAG: zf-HC2 domain-containing protein [Bryobacterales bacterium]|nr:zf-HC2 domain-containing protein [Bryobacteraceae bacterium]MDW8354291.1 zf-HC2 domain-containing protein [Bryobacterales bacterium]